MNVGGTTELPSRLAGSQDWAGSNIVTNQPGVMIQYGVESGQGSSGAASYLPLSGSGSPTDATIMSDAVGMGANVPAGLSTMGRASGGVHVSPSLLSSISYSDRPGEHRQCPGPSPQPILPQSTIPD